MLVHPTARALGYEGLGDYALEPDGRLLARGESRCSAFVFAGVMGLVMGAYSLFLPHTPPAGKDKKDYAPGVIIGTRQKSDRRQRKVDGERTGNPGISDILSELPPVRSIDSCFRRLPRWSFRRHRQWVARILHPIAPTPCMSWRSNRPESFAFLVGLNKVTR